jgi:hypothetical protein
MVMTRKGFAREFISGQPTPTSVRQADNPSAPLLLSQEEEPSLWTEMEIRPNKNPNTRQQVTHQSKHFLGR